MNLFISVNYCLSSSITYKVSKKVILDTNIRSSVDDAIKEIVIDNKNIFFRHNNKVLVDVELSSNEEIRAIIFESIKMDGDKIVSVRSSIMDSCGVLK